MRNIAPPRHHAVAVRALVLLHEMLVRHLGRLEALGLCLRLALNHGACLINVGEIGRLIGKLLQAHVLLVQGRGRGESGMGKKVCVCGGGESGMSKLRREARGVRWVRNE